MLKRRSVCWSIWILMGLGYFGNAAPGPAPGIPEWVHSASQAQLSEKALESDAVCLLHETSSLVNEQGETTRLIRLVYRVLAPEGRNVSSFRVSFDNDTKVRDLKGWNLKPDGSVHSVTLRDAVETQLTSDTLFEDTRYLILQIPQVAVGSLIAFEMERRQRPQILQDLATLQRLYPTLINRYTLELPPGWTFRYRMLRHSDIPPTLTSDNRWTWEVRDLPGIAEEQLMPPIASLAATLAISYFPGVGSVRGHTFAAWDDLARWVTTLMAPRMVPSSEMEAFVQETADWQALASFVHEQIRYVAIEIGIGGYQPHPASDTFQTRYGDCKDKVTLLRSLYRAAGRDLYPVLINASGSDPDPEFPSPFFFDHMIAAIAVDQNWSSPATFDHPQIGKLLLFDPTEKQIPFGQLPHRLQGRKALLVRGLHGDLIDTPVVKAARNRLLRLGHFKLLESGRLEGKVQELFRGALAYHERRMLLNRTEAGWVQMNEAFLSRRLPGAILTSMGVKGLDNGDSLNEAYEFRAPFFAHRGGDDVLLVRPCVLGSRVVRLPSNSEREHPLQFIYLRLYSDMFDIELPDGAVVDAIPEPVELDLPFARYRASVEHEGNLLKYSRSLEIKKLELTADTVGLLKEFYHLVDRDERSVVMVRLANQDASLR